MLRSKHTRYRGMQRKGPGFVYVLWSPRDAELKVGGIANLSDRLRGLRSTFGQSALYIGYWSVTDVWAAERAAHAVCKPLRIHSERYLPRVDWLGEYLIVRILADAFGEPCDP